VPNVAPRPAARRSRKRARDRGVDHQYQRAGVAFRGEAWPLVAPGRATRHDAVPDARRLPPTLATARPPRYTSTPRVRFTLGQYRPLGCEVLAQEVRGHRLVMAAVRGPNPAPPRSALHAFFTHDCDHPPPPDANAPTSQLSVDPRTPVGASAERVDRADLGTKRDFLRVRSVVSVSPSVEPARGHLEHAAHHDHRPVGLLRVDPGELHLLSLAKKAAAFLECRAPF